MLQTINMTTEIERQLEDIDKAVRDTQYPPVQGGPTKDELTELLRGAAGTIEDLDMQMTGMENQADRVEELESVIEDADDKIDDILINLSLAVESGELPACKTLEDMETKLMEIRSDLRRA